MLKLRSLAVAVVIALVAAASGVADEKLVSEPVTLMGMLQEWIYPDAAFGGAQTADAAVTGISAIKSQAVLLTPDPVEKVVEFYRKKLNVDQAGNPLGAKGNERITTERSVLIQTLPGANASSLYIIAINAPASSTTLVISRADEAAITHIAWSNFRQLGP